MVEQVDAGQELTPPTIHIHTYSLGSMEAVIGQVAARKGLPGITATIGGTDVAPEGIYVVIKATAEGEDWLSRLSNYPFTKAAILLAGAAEDRRVATQAPTYSRDHRLDGVLNPEDPERFNRLFGSPASRKERRAVQLLNAHGYLQRGYLEISNSDLPSPRVLIEEAVDQLLHPPVSVAHRTWHSDIR